MIETDIITVPYFVYDDYNWAEVCLEDSDALDMLEQIESGKSPFDVIPCFTRDIFSFHMKKSFPYGRFESRREIYINDEIFDSRQVSKQIGKLLVPYYNVMSKENMTFESENKNISSYDQNLYKSILSKNPEVDLFYSTSMRWESLNTEKIFVLKKEQLE